MTCIPKRKPTWKLQNTLLNNSWGKEDINIEMFNTGHKSLSTPENLSLTCFYILKERKKSRQLGGWGKLKF